MADIADLYIFGDDMEQYFANLYLDEMEENEELQLLFEEAVEEVSFFVKQFKNTGISTWKRADLGLGLL